jgi:adenosylmethionine-8-amino-7-oxononanoate aminotransferase
VFFYPGGTGDHGDIVILGPAFTIDEDHIEQMTVVLRESIDAAIAGHGH